MTPTTTSRTDDLLARFAAIYDALRAEHETWTAAAWLRFAAFAVILRPGEPARIAHAIRVSGDALRRHAAWYEGLASPMRFVVAAMLLHSGAEPRRFAAEVDAVRTSLRQVGLRTGHVREWDALAAVIHHLMTGGKALSLLESERIKAIYDGMKRHHWWLTGPDDLPACVLLSFRPESAVELADDADRLYQLLKTRGFASGDALQTAANLLVLAGLPTVVAAKRADDIARACSAHGVDLVPQDYGILAPLTQLDHEPEIIALRVAEYRPRLAELDPPLPGGIATTLAADLAFLDLVRVHRDGALIKEPKAARAMLERIHLHHGIAAILAMNAAEATAALGYPPIDPAWPYGPV